MKWILKNVPINIYNISMEYVEFALEISVL